MQAAARTIDASIEADFLRTYLTRYRDEVETILVERASPEWWLLAAERTRRIKCDIALLRSCGRAEDEIKEAIIDRYDLTPTYAQNFLDDDAEEEDELRRWLV